MHEFPRLPVRFIEENQELLKSQSQTHEVLSGGHAGAGTDWVATEAQLTAHMEAQFRAPGDRNLGNVLFRRNPDASLDIENATHVVVDMIHKAKDKLPLTELEKITLGILFPAIFEYVDPRLATPMMAIHLRLTSWEVALVSQKVAEHLTNEMNYNAGLGGGGDPGRTQVRS